MFRKLKELFISFTTWLKENQDELVIFSFFIMLSLIVAMCVSLLIAFWMNGLYPSRYRFEVSLGYTGVGVLVTGVISLFGLYLKSYAQEIAEKSKHESNNSMKKAEIAATIEKYKIASQFNSEPGEEPIENENFN